MTSEAPARCPFCGSEPQYVPQNSSLPAAKGGYTQFIWCENCGCQGPDRQTPQEAIAAWNRRLPLPEDGGAGRVAEPVAWADPDLLVAFKTNPWTSGHMWSSNRDCKESSIPLYASPPTPIPAAEPVGTPVVTEERYDEIITEVLKGIEYPGYTYPSQNLTVETGRAVKFAKVVARKALAFSKGAQNG